MQFVFFIVASIVSMICADVLETHHVVHHEPILAKVGTVVHTNPSAVSHQSFTRVHNKAVVAPLITPVVKTTSVHSASAPTTVIEQIHTAPVVKTSVHHSLSSPTVVEQFHTSPIVKTTSVHTGPTVVEHVSPVVKAVHSVHTPVVHTAEVPVVHTSPLLKTVFPASTYTIHH